MKNIFVLSSLVFGLSLFGVNPLQSVVPVTISVADIIVLFLLCYSAIYVGYIGHNAITKAMILFAIVLLASGVYNKWTYAPFDEGSFFVNYLRILGLVTMLLVLPPLLRRIGSDRLAIATIWAMRINCFVLLLDAFHFIPSAFLPGPSRSIRAAGFFLEPGWFGIWMGISFFYILQVQRNLNRRFLTLFDIGLIGISVLASTGMRGVVLIGIAMVVMITLMKGKTRLVLFGGILIAGILIVPMSNQLNKVSKAALGLSYVLDRLEGMSPTDLSDSSMLGRLVSTGIAVRYTMKTSPILGLGVGGQSRKRLPWHQEYGSTTISASGSNMTFSAIFLAGGILALAIYLFIIIKITMSREASLFGFCLIIVSIIWGGAFEPFIWWYIALAIALMGTKQTVNKSSLIAIPIRRPA